MQRRLASICIAAAALILSVTAAAASSVTYWSLFNIEGESAVSAQYVTYATRADMLNDTNRLGVFDPTGGFVGENIVGSGSDGSTYWSLFNIEGESAVSAQYVTYATLADMLGDTDRLGVFDPTGGFVGENIVGSGSDGSTYWSLFNIEGESAVSAQYVTYGTLLDMLLDTNRLGVFDPTGGFAGDNIVGSGSDGSTYWNLFNIEGDSIETAQYVTYATLADMLTDTNRLDVFVPSGGFAGANITGSGASIVARPQPPAPIPLPTGAWLLGTGLLLLGLPAARRRPRHPRTAF